jgi:hypothetical protein
MSYALVWRYLDPKAAESGDNYPQVLIGHPGTFSASEEEAKDEGRRVLSDEQIDEQDRGALTPLSIVEVNEDIGDDIQEQCDEVEIGTELLFYDLDNFARWQGESWWPRA